MPSRPFTGPTAGLMMDLDLVLRRAAPCPEEELADIEFADMEPVDDGDVIGVFPHEATATISLPSYDLVGVQPFSAVAVLPRGGRPFDGRPKGLSPEELETEEYHCA